MKTGADTSIPLEDTYRYYFDHNPLPQYIYDVETLRILKVNNAAVAHYGYSREEFLAMTLYDMRPEEERERLKQSVHQPWSGIADAGVWIHRKKNGELIHAMIHFGQFELEGRTVRLIVAHDITQKVEMEKRLRESEARHRALMEQSVDGIFVTDETGRYMDVNNVGALMLGYSREEIIGLSIPDLIQPSEHVRVGPELARTLQGGTVISQWRFRRKDGSQFLGEVRARYLDDRRILGVLRDITASQAAEDALRASEERFRVVVENVPDFIIMFDREGRLIFINRLLPGYTMDKVLGSDSYNFVDPRYHARHRQGLEAVFLHGESFTYEVQGAGSPGELRWYMNRMTPLKTNGVTVAALLVATDITGLKQDEEFITRFARMAPYIVYVFDFDERRVVWSNRHIAQDLGYPTVTHPPEHVEVNPENLLKYMHPEDAQRVPALMSRWATTPDGVVLQTEYRLKHADGSWRNYLGRDSVFLRNATGGVKQTIGSIEDITEHKQLEEQLRQSQKLDSIGRLAGGIAHDFNNLLTSILGHVQMALQNLPSDSRAVSDLEVIRIAAERSADLTSQLLSFARKQIIQPRLVNLNDLMQETQRLLLRVLGENIEMLAVPYPNLGLVRIDPGQMTQVLINLAVNARDAMPSGGKLTISSGHMTVSAREATPELAAGEYVTLSVSDSGTGMSELVLRHIFEPFFTTKGVGQGTGLGLATCYGIIKQAQGHIDVQTEAGKGSTFTLYLPRADAGSAPMPAIPKLPQTSGTETLLIVEDDDMLRVLTSRFLAAQGYTVLTAANGAAALKTASEHPEIALLLTDMVMPKMSGSQLAKEMMEKSPRLRVVLMSGYTEDNLSEFNTTKGATGVLQKPFSLPVLAATVREMLDRKI